MTNREKTIALLQALCATTQAPHGPLAVALALLADEKKMPGFVEASKQIWRFTAKEPLVSIGRPSWVGNFASLEQLQDVLNRFEEWGKDELGTSE